eukprot:6660573-Heterocapsa_arctica.AAC.1
MAHRALAEFATARSPLRLHGRARMALQWWLAHLRHSPPRVIRVGGFGDHVTIFTDGACEPGQVSVGAVLFDPRDGAILYFGLA